MAKKKFSANWNERYFEASTLLDQLFFNIRQIKNILHTDY